MPLPFPAIFRLLAWLSLIGGGVGALLGFLFSGFAAGIAAACGALFGFVLWSCLAWAAETLAAIDRRSEETAQTLSRLARSARVEHRPEGHIEPGEPQIRTAAETPAASRPQAAQSRGDATVEGWPAMLDYLLPVATHNGVALSPGRRGEWRATQAGTTTVYASAAELAAWLKTLPKP
jgi:hypothetical protein